MNAANSAGKDARAAFGAEFQPFLYEVIGDDVSGLPLSVLSVLARQDLDPWEQAASWSRMPAQAATTEVVTVIASVPPGLSARPAPERIAERLMALLPPERTVWAARPLRLAPSADNKIRNRLSMILFYVSFAVLGQWIISGMRDSATADRPVAATSAGTVTPAPAPDRD
jgi:hypothetical protein